MGNNELNKWIHENVIGECWHEFAVYRAIHDNKFCLRGCGQTRWEKGNPDYCESLDAVSKAEAKVIETFDRQRYGEVLRNILNLAFPKLGEETEFEEALTAAGCATARQRAEAVKLAWER